MRRCPECGGTPSMRKGGIVHVRSCGRAFSELGRLPPGTEVTIQAKPDSLTGSTRSLASLRSQSDREAALRRAICGACPRVPFGFVSGLVSKVVQLDLELEAKGENHR